VTRADLGGDLGVHQRLRQDPHPLPHEVDIAGLGIAHELDQFHRGDCHRVLLETSIRSFVFEDGPVVFPCNLTKRDHVVAVSRRCSGTTPCDTADYPWSYTTPWDANRTDRVGTWPLRRRARQRFVCFSRCSG
jgi:hypothetical protein